MTSTGGDNSANQTAINGALSGAGNDANTKQSNTQTQTAGGSGCLLGCGGSGQAQINDQQALTAQLALSSAKAKQNAVNANVPVNIAGYNIYGGANSANQTAINGALSGAGNSGRHRPTRRAERRRAADARTTPRPAPHAGAGPGSPA